MFVPTVGKGEKDISVNEDHGMPGLLAEAACEQFIDMLGDVATPAVADPDERRKLAHLLARSRVCADERAEQFQGALGLFLAEPADEQLQPLPRCHTSSLTVGR